MTFLLFLLLHRQPAPRPHVECAYRTSTGVHFGACK